ncbi:hypothetical protein hairong_072 [Pseudomonas phage hairong]|nr:hypothetical protein hairong_072 [Pseudomonas phage hairong]
MSEDKKDGLHFRIEDHKAGETLDTEEACFMKLDRLGDLLNSPGSIQYEILQHPEYGPVVKEATNKMLMAAVEGVNFDSEPDEACIVAMHNQVGTLTATYLRFVTEEIGLGAVAMQVLGMSKLIKSIEPFDKATGVTPEIAKRLKEALAKAGRGDQMLAAQPHPAFGKIINAGIRLSGGSQEAFANHQTSVLNRMPPVVRSNPNTSIPTQICGAIMELISERSITSQMMLGITVGVLQSVLAAKRFTSLPVISDWQSTAPEISKNILLMAQNVILDKVDMQKMSKRLADDAIEKMMRDSTQPGNETKH